MSGAEQVITALLRGPRVRRWLRGDDPQLPVRLAVHVPSHLARLAYGGNDMRPVETLLGVALAVLCGVALIMLLSAKVSEIFNTAATSVGAA